MRDELRDPTGRINTKTGWTEYEVNVRRVRVPALCGGKRTFLFRVVIPEPHIYLTAFNLQYISFLVELQIYYNKLYLVSNIPKHVCDSLLL